MFLKRHKKLLVFCLLLLIYSIITYSIDSRLVSQDKKPIFVMKTAVVQDGGTTIYKGLGYKVIGWNQMAVRQINGKKVNGKLVGYEISTWFNPQNIDNGPKKKLKFVSSE